MKKIKSLTYLYFITSFMLLVFFGTLYGASMTTQREAAAHNGTDATSIQNDTHSQLTFAPQRLKDKNDVVSKSEGSGHRAGMKQYKQSMKGEGEKKILP